MVAAGQRTRHQKPHSDPTPCAPANYKSAAAKRSYSETQLMRTDKRRPLPAERPVGILSETTVRKTKKRTTTTTTNTTTRKAKRVAFDEQPPTSRWVVPVLPQVPPGTGERQAYETAWKMEDERRAREARRTARAEANRPKPTPKPKSKGFWATLCCM